MSKWMCWKCRKIDATCDCEPGDSGNLVDVTHVFRFGQKEMRQVADTTLREHDLERAAIIVANLPLEGDE